jgi:hypothetical protein
MSRNRRAEHLAKINSEFSNLFISSRIKALKVEELSGFQKGLEDFSLGRENQSDSLQGDEKSGYERGYDTGEKVQKILNYS